MPGPCAVLQCCTSAALFQHMCMSGAAYSMTTVTTCRLGTHSLWHWCCRSRYVGDMRSAVQSIIANCSRVVLMQAIMHARFLLQPAHLPQHAVGCALSRAVLLSAAVAHFDLLSHVDVCSPCVV
jgi:hypothetical protein